jgi:hypothetical protein
MFGGLKNYIIYVAASCSLLFCNFFDYSTIYGAANISTPYINGNQNVKDDYKYNIGIRKIALYDYQERNKFYKGNEQSLSDKAIIGAVNGVEYLFSASSVRNRGYAYLDQEHWIKWSNNAFVTKFKYINKESRDLQFFDYDARFRLNLNKVNITLGGSIKGHPVYGHPAIWDYDGVWFELAWDYGYEDFEVPLNDLNENGIIDDYYLWIETDPVTEEGYWIYFYEGVNYYWEDPEGNYVAGSDEEFYQYHYPHLVEMYNEDNEEKEWQSEASIVVGLDILLGNDNYYSHIWVNAFPYSVGLTDKAYNGDDIQYDVGMLVGTNLNEHIGVFIEGIYQSYYGKQEYNISTGINWRF